VRGQSAFIPCADGLREIKLEAGTSLTSGWQAPQQVTDSPVVGGNTVYRLDPDGGMFYALDTATGAVRASIFVGTMAGIVAVGMV
jgi:polyvinyl alcohol dehydrogenase (cytochrome)